MGEHDRVLELDEPREAMFAISWSEAGSVVTESRETVAGAIALINEAAACKLENLIVTDIETGRAVTIELLRQIAGTELIGQRIYRTRGRAASRVHS
jgi:hypothetical protein